VKAIRSGQQLDFDRFRRVGRNSLGGIWLLDVDSALEERAIFNADACCRDVAIQRALCANINPVCRRNVPAYLAEDHNLASRDVGRHLTVATNGHAVSREVDAAFDLAVNKERLRSGDLALDEQALADRRLRLGGGADLLWTGCFY